MLLYRVVLITISREEEAAAGLDGSERITGEYLVGPRLIADA